MALIRFLPSTDLSDPAQGTLIYEGEVVINFFIGDITNISKSTNLRDKYKNFLIALKTEGVAELALGDCPKQKDSGVTLISTAKGKITITICRYGLYNSIDMKISLPVSEAAISAFEDMTRHAVSLTN
jgi:hypothetical protein